MGKRATSIAVIGCGYWGAKWVRNVAESPSAKLASIYDPDTARSVALADRYHSVAAASFDQILADSSIEGVILATPGDLHFEQAAAALRSGKHVLVEKPMVTKAADAETLHEIAAANALVLMSGHTFLFSEPVKALKRLIGEGHLGEVLYAYAQRLGLGAFRSDMNAIWDLAPHDLSILLHVLGKTPVAVQATQFSLLDDPKEDIGFMTLSFADGSIAHIHNSRLDPRKVRLLTFVGSSGMVVYDDTDGDAPLRIYDRSAEALEQTGRRNPKESLEEFRFELRDGAVTLPKIPAGEPLQSELNHFIDRIADRKEPLSGALLAGTIAAILTAAESSANDSGCRVELDGASP